jgi:hypothetical protein
VETNRYAAQRQTLQPNRKQEDITAREIQACRGILIYIGPTDLPEIHGYFLDDFCLCSTVRQAMTLWWLEKIGQHPSHTDNEDRSRSGDENYDYHCKAWPTHDIINKSGQVYKLGCNIAADEAMTGFKWVYSTPIYAW